jgi:predicted dehydrogenase
MALIRKARIGFIGAGWWATANHMPIMAARPDVVMAGVCRLGRSELADVQRQFGIPFGTEDYRDLLANCELDGVVVSSPHSLHYEHARAALEAGLHVMVEKPMCTRADHARELVRIARDKGLTIVVPYGWHYKPFIQDAKRRIDAGALGRVEFVMCHMASPIRRLLAGHGLRMERNAGYATETMFQPEAATWSDPTVAGGGYGHAQISHSSGMLFWLTGLVPRQVFAMMAASGTSVELFDAISVRFDGNAIGTFSGAGTVPEKDARYQVDLRVFGTDGMLLLDCERTRLEIHRTDGEHVVADLAAGDGAYCCDGPPQNFVDLVLGKTDSNFAPGDAAMRSVELLDAAYRSAASGKLEAV